MNTLGDLRGSAHYFAESGGEGGSHFKTGRDAPEATVFVPPGIIVTDIEVYPHHIMCAYVPTEQFHLVWFWLEFKLEPPFQCLIRNQQRPSVTFELYNIIT